MSVMLVDGKVRDIKYLTYNKISDIIIIENMKGIKNMTFEERVSKATLNELDEMEKIIKTRKLQLNPFAELKSLSNKQFGEDWSEKYILSKVPNLHTNHGAGHDMSGKRYKNIEVKSSRILFSRDWTMNQIHPDQADAYLFVWYNCSNGTQDICLIPTADLLSKCTRSKQHGNGCFTVSSTQNNRAVLRQYMISSWEDLNEVV